MQTIRTVSNIISMRGLTVYLPPHIEEIRMHVFQPQNKSNRAIGFLIIYVSWLESFPRYAEFLIHYIQASIQTHHGENIFERSWCSILAQTTGDPHDVHHILLSWIWMADEGFYGRKISNKIEIIIQTP